MFNELIESKPKKQRSTGGTVFSVVMHAVLGGLLIYATANAGQELTKEKTEEVKFVEVPKDEPPPPEEKAPPPEIVVAPPGPLALTPGARLTVAMSVRPIGRSSMSLALKFVCTSVVSRTAGALAVTVIDSATVESRISASAREVVETPTSTVLVMGCMLSNSKRTV